VRLIWVALCLALGGMAHAEGGSWFYPDPEGRYRIALPDGWTATRIDGSRLWLRWPEGKPTREACNVVVVDNSFTSDYSQTELDGATRGGLFEPLALKQISWAHREAKLMEKSIVEFQGHPAQSAEVSFGLPGADKASAGVEYSFFFAVPGRVYQEYCDVHTDHFARMRPVLDRVMRSLEFARL
jgi:hypothetical protein